MSCKQCNKNVAVTDQITCRGYCGGIFHVICVKVDFPLLDQLGLYERNTFWMCDGCADLFRNSHFHHVSGHFDNAIADMRNEIARLSSVVAEISTKAAPATPTWPVQERPLLGAKRRFQHPTATKPVPPQPSQGKKVLTVPIPVIPRSVPADKYYIWLGSFPTNVTEGDITTMVKACLSCDDGDTIETKALVKNGVNIKDMRSVTFKVGVDKKYREASLDANNWPEGVSFREFLDFGKKINLDGASPGFLKTPRLTPKP